MLNSTRTPNPNPISNAKAFARAIGLETELAQEANQMDAGFSVEPLAGRFRARRSTWAIESDIAEFGAGLVGEKGITRGDSTIVAWVSSVEEVYSMRLVQKISEEGGVIPDPEADYHGPRRLARQPALAVVHMASEPRPICPFIVWGRNRPVCLTPRSDGTRPSLAAAIQIAKASTASDPDSQDKHR